MLGKVKKWLGIEGVKLELVLPEEVEAGPREINGSIRFQSLNPQIVTSIKIMLIEKYPRGRGKEKLIDEYELGVAEIRRTIEVPAEELVDGRGPQAIPGAHGVCGRAVRGLLHRARHPSQRQARAR